MKYFPQNYMLTKCLGCEILELFFLIKRKKVFAEPCTRSRNNLKL